MRLRKIRPISVTYGEKATCDQDRYVSLESDNTTLQLQPEPQDTRFWQLGVDTNWSTA